MIKKRNLDPSLIQWIMNQTGLGPGIGELHWVAPASSATSQFRTQLQSWGVEQNYKIHTSVTDAEDEAVAYRNDVVMVMPGLYTESAGLTWDKAHTHMLGLGGPNVGGDWAEPNVVIRTTGIAVGTSLNITAQNGIFQNFNITNYGDNTACLAAATLASYSVTFKNVNFQNMMTAGSDGVTAAAALYVGQGTYNAIFEDCTIGQNGWDIRTAANSGVVRFTNTDSNGPVQNSTFRRCRFLSRSETATVAMVAIPVNYCIGRGWLFDNCHFANLSIDWGNNLNQVFYDACATTHDIMLHNCSAIGFDEWQDADAGNNYIGSDMPIVGLGGGLARNPTAVTGS